MKLVDTNVLVHVANGDSADHAVAKGWLDRALSGSAPVGFAWLALVGFVRLVTNPRIVPSPYTVGEAMMSVDAWLGARSAHVLQPGRSHALRFRQMLEAAGSGANLTNDAHLAAIALEHRATVVSFDDDFGRFPGVKWERPR